MDAGNLAIAMNHDGSQLNVDGLVYLDGGNLALDLSNYQIDKPTNLTLITANTVNGEFDQVTADDYKVRMTYEKDRVLAEISPIEGSDSGSEDTEAPENPENPDTPKEPAETENVGDSDKPNNQENPDKQTDSLDKDKGFDQEAKKQEPLTSSGQKLPGTATPIFQYLLTGVILSLTGIIFFFMKRKKV